MLNRILTPLLYLPNPAKKANKMISATTEFASKPAPLCALVVGHSRGDGGAVSRSGKVSEYAFNDALAQDILCAVDAAKCRVVVMYREHGYKALPGEINKRKPDFVIEMHANAANGKASGTEVLHWKSSTAGKIYASILLDRLALALGLPNRGLKPVGSDGRGGYLLEHTHAPAMIAEPFFIDNDGDLAWTIRNREKLVRAYADAIEMIGTIIATKPIK